MKSRSKFTASIIAALTLFTIQFPSNAEMPRSLSMASGMSTAQIKLVGAAINASFAQAMAGAKTTKTDSNITATATLTASGRYKCSLGGYINTSYTIRSVSFKNTGNVTMSGSGQQTLTDWRCVKGWVINGDPYISHTLTGSVFAGKTSMSGTMGGGWKSTGPNKAKQSCQLRANTQYAANGRNGVTTIHITCVPGGLTNITERF